MGQPPGSFLPVVRTLSRPITAGLERTPVSPTLVTLANLAAGLLAAALFVPGTHGAALAGSLALVGCYLLDNCDGDLARRRGVAGPRGALLDTLADSLVHVALFAAMGIGLTRAGGDPLWLWLGTVAAAGAGINSAIAIRRDLRALRATGIPDTVPEPAPEPAPDPTPPGGTLIDAIRTLGRDDFCFLLLVATWLDAHHLLLAASAAGAQAYWITSLLDERRHAAGRRRHRD